MGRRHTVLVVDDEPDVVQSVKDLLRLDYHVLGTTRAEEGIEMMRDNPVDVIMTDQRMPTMTGVELLSQIKGKHPEATRLLFTGYADIRAVIDAINQGNVYRYITKPWDPDELQLIIREACERHDLIVQRRELMDELETRNRELSEANDLKSAFIQVASHELRTPLAILLGYSELAQKLGATGQTRDWLGRIHQAAERLKSLINQIIAMLQAGEFQAQCEHAPVQLGAFIQTAVDDVAPFIELRHQQLVRDWPDDLGAIEMDAAKIRDSINHLLLNAIKFTPDGGRITVLARREADGALRVSISDTGSGIDEAELKRYGEAFFTGFDVTRHSSGTYEHGRRGLGLGASVVKKFVELHGGSVQVQSTVGKGTTATILLPAQPVVAAK